MNKALKKKNCVICFHIFVCTVLRSGLFLGPGQPKTGRAVVSGAQAGPKVSRPAIARFFSVLRKCKNSSNFLCF